MHRPTGKKIVFPPFSGLRCLMMPYRQGDPASVPDAYDAYREIIKEVFLQKGEIGFLTIDESPVAQGKPHRGEGARYDRAIHTEAGKHLIKTTPGGTVFRWGWGKKPNVKLDADVNILLASNLDDSCAVWDATHQDTSRDGDIGFAAHLYPYSTAVFLKAGDVHEIGILTPHESLPVKKTFNRQFLRIIGSGVHGREDNFTENPLVPLPQAMAMN